MSENVKKCCSCGAVLKFAYDADFRVGGTGDQDNLLFGEFVEVSENVFPLNVYVCSNCGKIELFADREIKNSLLRIANKHNRQGLR
jgi:hypothetical protein